MRKTELVIFITPHIVEDDQISDVRNDTPSLNSEIIANQVKNEDNEKEEETANEENNEDENTATESSSNDEEETKTADVKNENEQTATASTEKFNSLSQEELQQVLNTSRKTRDYGEEIPNNLNLFYTVGADESIQDIAYKYGISAEKIALANNDRTNFERGDSITLLIPGSHLVRIKEDQSIQSIMNEYEVTLKQILELNQLKSVDEIKSNMLLVLPKEVR
ncbi:MAG: LysM domain-containing protein [Halanaerobiales bacterium]|nr:LysM domain-containing protein [Halanaerobiales bacterium]